MASTDELDAPLNAIKSDEEIMIRLCAWCKANMGNMEPLEDKSISHGMCRDCELENTIRFNLWLMMPKTFTEWTAFFMAISGVILLAMAFWSVLSGHADIAGLAR